MVGPGKVAAGPRRERAYTSEGKNATRARNRLFPKGKRQGLFHPEGRNWAMHQAVVKSGRNEFKRGRKKQVNLRMMCVKTA